MGLDRWIGVSWVRWWHGFGLVMADGFGTKLGFGFWIWDRRGSAEIGDRGDFFFFFAWFDGGSDGGVWLGLN